MSKIEDALKKIEAAREQASSSEGENLPPPASVVVGSMGLAKIDERIVALHHPGHAEAAAFSQFHTEIRNNDEGVSAIGFTSTRKGEGKSVVALNFAVALARDCEGTVCIVDADLRRPSLHRLFGIDNTTGLSDALAGTASPLSFVLPTPIERLSFLLAGTETANPARLFASHRLKEVIGELKSHFTYAVFDCAPVLGIPETKDLALRLDGVVFVVEAKRTNKRSILEAKQKLQPSTGAGDEGANILGFIFNKAEA